MTAWVFAVGRMLGLGSVAGIRPSMTLAVIGIVSKLGWGVGLNPTFSFLGHWLAIIIFVVLAIFESSFDKIAKLDRLQGRLTMPYRLIAGGAAGRGDDPLRLAGRRHRRRCRSRARRGPPPMSRASRGPRRCPATLSAI